MTYPTSNAVQPQTSKAFQTGQIPGSPPQSKALGQGSPSSKALGAGNPELAAWYEQAYSYYNAVMSGQEPMPSQAEWNEFLQWMSWAVSQLGMDWNPMVGQGYPQGAQDPNMGTENNVIHDAKEVEVTDSGQGGRHDVWCDEFTLDIPAHSAKTTVEYTQEGNPPEDVIKIIVKNQATGQETVYFVHNTEAKIKINAANPDNVIDNTGVVEIGEYVEKGGSSDGTFVEGARETNEIEENTWEYEGQGDKPIEIYSQGNGVDAPDQHHYPYGNTEIILSNSDEVTVEKDGDEYVVTITHKDGSRDIVHCDPQWFCNFITTIDGGTDYDSIEQITLIDENGQKHNPLFCQDFDTGEQVVLMPEPFCDEFTINGAECKEPIILTGPGLQPEPMEAGASSGPYPDIINQLASMMGMDAADLAELINGPYQSLVTNFSYYAGEDGKLNGPELQKAIDEGAFPPVTPNVDLITLFAENDPKLKNLLSQLPSADPEYSIVMKQISLRTIELLKTVYPGVDIKMENESVPTWYYANNILFDGHIVEAFAEPGDQNYPTTGQPKWQVFT